jgi:chromate transporter
MARPGLGHLLRLFFRLVNFTFGGGDPTMAALQREMVDRHGWLTPEQYGLAYGLARVTPGTNVLAFCAAVAWMLRGWRGAVVAVVAGTIPSTILVVWMTYGYQSLKTNAVALSAIAGMLAAAVGMMFAAAWNLVRPAFAAGDRARSLLLAAVAAALIVSGLSPVPVLALAAASGYIWTGRQSQ